jgi:hypothetical protein
VIKSQVLLKTVYRQHDEGICFIIARSSFTHIYHLPDFIRALNRCRIADLDDEIVQLFSSLSRPIPKDFLPQCQPVYLFSTRQETGDFNKCRLSSITSSPVVFKSYDWSKNKTTEHLFGTLPVDSSVKLKIGAQVMLVRNVDDGLTNGTVGVVKGFYTYKGATGDRSYQKKIGFVRNIQVIEQGIPASYADNPSDTSKAFPLVEFLICNRSEHVLVLPMEFRVDLKGEAAVKRVQVRDVAPSSISVRLTIYRSRWLWHGLLRFTKVKATRSRRSLSISLAYFPKESILFYSLVFTNACHRPGLCCALSCSYYDRYASKKLFS